MQKVLKIMCYLWKYQFSSLFCLMSSSKNILKPSACPFCNSTEDNILKYGKLLQDDGINYHTNCLFFASGLYQKEDDSSIYSICGFDWEDIDAEIQRGKKLVCTYCEKRGATIGCCEISCPLSFHLNCGIKNGTLHHFFGTYQSFCPDHQKKQKAVKMDSNTSCSICREKFNPDGSDFYLYAPCCKNNFFHKLCIQQYALSTGWNFFKCPMCGNRNKFRKEMENQGIDVPEIDPFWETDRAYEENLAEPECDAPICNCPYGRNYRPSRKCGWSILNCSICGFHARHKKCEDLKLTVKYWKCNECTSMSHEIALRRKSAEM